MASVRFAFTFHIFVFLFLTPLATCYERRYETDNSADDDLDDDYDEQLVDYDDLDVPMEKNDISVTKRDETPAPCVVQQPGTIMEAQNKKTKKINKKQKKHRGGKKKKHRKGGKQRKHRKGKKKKKKKQKIKIKNVSKQKIQQNEQNSKTQNEALQRKVSSKPQPSIPRSEMSLQDLIDELDSQPEKKQVEEKLFTKRDCSSPWVWISPGYCFYIIHSEYGNSWAKKLCAKEGGRFLTINSNEKADAVKKLSKGYFKQRGDYWMSSIGISKDGVAYWESSEEPLAYTNFARDIISDYPCMTLNKETLEWQEVIGCNFQFKLTICEKDGEVDNEAIVKLQKPKKPKPEPQPDKLLSQELCTSPWVWISPGYCFYSSTKKARHGTAAEICSKEGGHLLTINSREKARALGKYAVEHFKYRMDYWLSSLAKSEDGVTYWKATNEPLEYTNFASSRPLDNNACMSLDHQTLAWKPVLFCQYKFKYTLCGKES